MSFPFLLIRYFSFNTIAIIYLCIHSFFHLIILVKV